MQSMQPWVQGDDRASEEGVGFDIKNTAAVYADSISSSVEDSHSIHNIYDVGEYGNRDKLARILDSAVEDCNEMLSDIPRWKCLVAASIPMSGKNV